MVTILPVRRAKSQNKELTIMEGEMRLGVTEGVGVGMILLVGVGVVE